MSYYTKLKPARIYKITLKHHVMFWLIYFLFNTFRWGSYFNDYLYSLQTNLIGFPIHMSLCYLNLYVLMPVFLFKRRILFYILSLLSAIFLMVLLKFNLTYFLVSTDVWPEGPEIINHLTMNYIVDMMIGELYVIAFVAAIKITFDWLEENKRLTDLEKIQLETELQFLRAQVSPHFFLNTLNNIYALSITNSNKTSKVIIKLAGLLKYLLYETRKKRQTLENELHFIENYLEIERIRHGNKLVIDMNISGDIHNKTIAPMLLISFIENAFKHGVNKNIDKVKISINFKVKKNYLYFYISNPKPQELQEEGYTNTMKYEGGIGLENVKKRLTLGYNQDDYILKIDDSGKNFNVKLKLKVV
ncbi:GHKL domain-containing protein [Algibacter pectinivorans]|uniref:GHKL domain-containing protein n=2 Tax=Algibacter pectinivorans TaxID=870482 RepID=A0A1I1PSN0_9FLAO|nr:histidine kinase [Algibacter pectinivorans]SFD12755.1 GHKL domain-containing protein [Algibacter pectinivorans]